MGLNEEAAACLLLVERWSGSSFELTQASLNGIVSDRLNNDGSSL